MNLNEQIQAITASLPALLPELVLALAFVLVLVVGLLRQIVVKLVLPLIALAALSAFFFIKVFTDYQAQTPGVLINAFWRPGLGRDDLRHVVFVRAFRQP